MSQEENAVSLPDTLADVFTPDRVFPESRSFACRPLTAHSAERNTALGFFTGDVGLLGVPDFKAALHNLAGEDTAKVILDLSAVNLSKSALGALIGFAAAMHGRNKRLYLFRPSAQVRSTLKQLKLEAFFSYLENEDDIIASLVV